MLFLFPPPADIVKLYSGVIFFREFVDTDGQFCESGYPGSASLAGATAVVVRGESYEIKIYAFVFQVFEEPFVIVKDNSFAGTFRRTHKLAE